MPRTFMVEVTDWTVDYNRKRLWGIVISDEEDIYEKHDEIEVSFSSKEETNDIIYFLTETSHKTFKVYKSQERHRRRDTK